MIMSTFNKKIETFVASVSEKVSHIAEDIIESIKHILPDSDTKSHSKENKICTDEIAKTFTDFADDIVEKFNQLAIDIKAIVKNLETKSEDHKKHTIEDKDKDKDLEKPKAHKKSV